MTSENFHHKLGDVVLLSGMTQNAPTQQTRKRRAQGPLEFAGEQFVLSGLRGVPCNTLPLDFD
jgi:hypothetical protein